ncbi:unannotated protein [freshwater metagenome]|uniref:Unannotated protein n=1 Tax=freshwater metagenome TaxID=449393 RepID=A0A6J7TCE0_9ZZZZ
MYLPTAAPVFRLKVLEPVAAVSVIVTGAPLRTVVDDALTPRPTFVQAVTYSL